jgi:hypothetical protein
MGTAKLQGNQNFFQMFLFTDEAAFTCHWKVNIRNVHYWAAEKP